MFTNTHNAIAFTSRALLSAVFISSGLSKALAPEAALGYISSVGLPFPMLALIAALIVELGFATALLLGYRTRWVALTLVGFSVATAAVFHHQFGDQNQLIHFLKNLAMAGGLLQVALYANPQTRSETSEYAHA